MRFDMKATWFTTSKHAADTCGTTAHLIEG